MAYLGATLALGGLASAAGLLAGGLGAGTRWAVDRLFSRTLGTAYPWGTQLINVTGSFALGLVTDAHRHTSRPSSPTGTASWAVTVEMRGDWFRQPHSPGPRGMEDIRAADFEH